MKVLEHRPENKERLAENLAEIVVSGTIIKVGELTDLLNGRDDGVSWDVTSKEVAAALDKLVRIGVLYRKDKGKDGDFNLRLRRYLVRPDYTARVDAGEDVDVRWLLAGAKK